MEFRDFSGFDRELYPKKVYHYYYILNVKDYYSEFKDIIINIVCPEEYVVSTHIDGKEEGMYGFKKTAIFIKNPEENLSIPYMEKRLSPLSIYLYRKFPGLYNPYPWLFMFGLLIFAGIITIVSFVVIKIIKRRKIKK